MLKSEVDVPNTGLFQLPPKKTPYPCQHLTSEISKINKQYDKHLILVYVYFSLF